MPKAHVRKGDTVVVLTGKDKGKKGVVEAVDPTGGKVTVEGVNVVKRHNKPKPPMQPSGSITEKNNPIHISNVMLVDPKTKQPTRTRNKVEGDKKVRVSAKTGKPV
ncbi:MAG: 50S ribosomal protein L24 [Candidatus Eremiobacteraeota bacterium]|nr:50S ribosomal protein L24 [Candidatus Eremiobacteraeota bacterium]MCW5867106.1 50S ribosomal protein L24 [Candidatus Eremiobacteraeota bacterium]